MKISEEKLDEFIALYKARYNKDIDRAVAYEQAMKLIQLMIYNHKPMSPESFAAIQKRRIDTFQETLKHIAEHWDEYP